MRIWIALIALLVVPVPASASVFSGLGTWIDIYDTHVIANPTSTVATATRQGVKTIYLETSNSTSPHTIMAATSLRRLITQAHAAGIKVVVWYLPTLAHLTLDQNRLVAATTFAGPGGVDGLAIDIESTAVARVSVRTKRLLKLFRGVRRAVAPNLPIASIIPAPPGMALRPTYWPKFPYAELSALSDAWLPMCYFTYRKLNSAATAAYAHDCVQMIRNAAPNVPLPIHVVGGLASGTSRAAALAFGRQMKTDRAAGISLYDLSTTRSGHWKALHDAGW